jgi:hypothetical protein
MTVTIPALEERYYATWTWDLVACVQHAGAALSDFNFPTDSGRICLRNSRRLRVIGLEDQ